MVYLSEEIIANITELQRSTPLELITVLPNWIWLLANRTESLFLWRRWRLLIQRRLSNKEKLLNLPEWMSFVEPQAPDSLPFSSSSLLFSSSSSCKDPPGLLRCLQDEWGKVIKNVWKSRTLDKLLWLIRGFVCQNSCFFMFLCTKKFEAFASGIKFLYPRGQRLAKKINRVVRGPSEKEPQTNWCYFTEQNHFVPSFKPPTMSCSLLAETFRKRIVVDFQLSYLPREK